MSREMDLELKGLLDRAERCGACLVAPERRHAAALRRRSPEIVSPAPGLFARASWWEQLRPDERALALMRGLHQQHPDWVFSGPSAALVHGTDVSWHLLSPLQVETRSRGSRSTELISRHAAGSELFSEKRDGVRVTPLLQTASDCLRALSFREGMTVADRAAREGSEFVDALRAWLEGQRGTRHGVDHALRTLSWADARAESGGESIARAVMIEQGFMLPALQVWVPDPLNPGRRFRVDFLWVRADGRVIIAELDGGAKSGDPRMTGGRSREEVLLAERRREALITAYDVSIVRFSFGEAAGVSELVRKLEFYGVPRASSLLALPGEPTVQNWESLRRR